LDKGENPGVEGREQIPGQTLRQELARPEP
jgi:hypothetical protein